MAIPKVKEIMLPLLKFVQDGHEHTFTEAIPFLANYFNLTEEEQNIFLRGYNH
jgi:restriction system protein